MSHIDPLPDDETRRPDPALGTYDDDPSRTEADRIRSDEIVEPAPSTGLRAEDAVLGDEDAVLTNADRLRADELDEPHVPGVGDEDALLTDAEKIEARDIDQ